MGSISNSGFGAFVVLVFELSLVWLPGANTTSIYWLPIPSLCNGDLAVWIDWQ